MILQGDCVEKMRELDEASIDAIVTDPPYGLHFMGKSWDQFGGPTGKDNTTHTERGGAMHAGKYDFTRNQEFQREMTSWAVECLRVLKPGGHLLAFGGTRTYHRLACAIEDAGFEIRDSLIWLYGSGFPKSLDVSKAIDKAAGAEREVVGRKVDPRYASPAGESSGVPMGNLDARDNGAELYEQAGNLTAPATPEAAQWEGWGTALKPGHEPIVMARKPLTGTVAQNVTQHGTGALNIDGCRIEGEAWKPKGPQTGLVPSGGFLYAEKRPCPDCDEGFDMSADGGNGRKCLGCNGTGEISSAPEVDKSPAEGGRWPANVLLSPEAAEELDEQSGERPTGAVKPYTENHQNASSYQFQRDKTFEKAADSGGASRFFYTAKASRGERNAGLDGFEEKLAGAMSGNQDGTLAPNPVHARNHHPTVKPIDLMRWLVRLVTPPGGTVLDPFTGSGTTGIAAVLEGFDFIGIEREAEYVAIAQARIAWWAQHAGRDTEDVLVEAGFSERLEREHREAGQLGLDL